MSEPLSPPPAAPPDPIIPALEQRARDLSMAIVNPKTLARKLKESLVEQVGDAARFYHIGASFDGENVHVQIAAVTPEFVFKLDGDSSGSATLGAAWVRTTEKGWRVSVGVEARAAIWDEAVEERVKSGAYSVGASFSVTVAR